MNEPQGYTGGGRIPETLGQRAGEVKTLHDRRGREVGTVHFLPIVDKEIRYESLEDAAPPSNLVRDMQTFISRGMYGEFLEIAHLPKDT